MPLKRYRVVIPVDGTLCYEFFADSAEDAAAKGLEEMKREFGPRHSLNIDSFADPIVREIKET